MTNAHIGKASDSAELDRWVRLAVRYLAVCDRTCAQVRHYILRKGARQDQVEQVVARLSDLRYLDDRAFAERWVARRMADRPMGRERLKYELDIRGVEDSIAESTIGRAFETTDEEQLARSALDAAQRRGRCVTPIQAVSFLRRRGFGEGTIGRMMEQCIGNEGSVS